MWWDFLADWRLWAMLPVIAVISWLMANYYMRKVFTRVAYHRKGNTVEILQCLEREGRVTFQTVTDPLTKKREEITVTKQGLPEIQVAGLKTFKLYHAVEGFGLTVDIRDVVEDKPDKSGSVVHTALSAMATAFELMARTVAKSKGDYLIIIGVGVLCFFLGFGWGKVL